MSNLTILYHLQDAVQNLTRENLVLEPDHQMLGNFATYITLWSVPAAHDNKTRRIAQTSSLEYDSKTRPKESLRDEPPMIVLCVWVGVGRQKVGKIGTAYDVLGFPPPRRSLTIFTRILPTSTKLYFVVHLLNGSVNRWNI